MIKLLDLLLEADPKKVQVKNQKDQVVDFILMKIQKIQYV
jgi:hypothetical protein